MRQNIRFIFAIALLCLCGQKVFGQNELRIKSFDSEFKGVVTYKVVSAKSIQLVGVKNDGEKSITVYVDNAEKGTVLPHNSYVYNIISKSNVRFVIKGGINFPIWNLRDDGKETKELWEQEHPEDVKPEEASASAPESSKPQQASKPVTSVQAKETALKPNSSQSSTPIAIGGEKKKERVLARTILLDFDDYLKNDDYYSESAINGMKLMVDSLCRAIETGTDSTVMAARQFLQEQTEAVESHKDEKLIVVTGFIDKYNDKEIVPDKASCVKGMDQALNKRLIQCQEYLNLLKQALDAKKGFMDEYGRVLIIGGTLLLLLLLLLFWFTRARKTAHTNTSDYKPLGTNNSGADSDIVIRRTTTTALKKQSLNDVVNNSSYLQIDSNDFCSDSSVTRIYIKNTCIKDIYDMYANDLRNPENPKEDGCMVLGRWVEDIDSGEYRVSLEQVVMPGDDAVFKEYELNFGGKIKMRVSDALRKLRRDTDLQYDLTCWVHSHPGLGVFFSNFDDVVHKQLKHHSHPKFLTAIVVDILTPRMEMGIFTFKKTDDLIVNSKSDITQLYSLEDMYKWALESIRSSYNPDDYFDVFSKAPHRISSCKKVMLSNSAIIDICQRVEGVMTNTIKWTYGFAREADNGTEFFVNRITDTSGAGEECLGCFIAGTHFSIPSIRKALGEHQDTVKFVMFYSSADSTLISLPVVDGALLMDENYYSRQQLEDLKIWTRRKR